MKFSNLSEGKIRILAIIGMMFIAYITLITAFYLSN
jgi:hypothetical protein